MSKHEPEHPDQDLPGKPGAPTRPDHDLPHRPGHPDHELPKPEPPMPPQPKGRQRAVRDASEPLTAVTRLLPPSAAIGDPSFVLRVIGSGFNETSVIVFADEDEETTFVSDVELTTLVDMSVWLGPDPAISVAVRTVVETGDETSNAVSFTFTPPREVPLPEAHASIPNPVMDLITPM
jgi:hypothetical protein